jgi:dolichyl-diphosphooligosaccharide--protein glycosyltransferase
MAILSQPHKTIIFFLLIAVMAVFIRSEYVRDGGNLLLRYDPYYHYRMAETIVTEGHKPAWDYTASWPTGEPGDRHPPLYHYFLAYTYRIFKGLTNNDLLLWCNYSCVIPVILFLILAFFVGTQLTNVKGGLFCALLFALVAFLVRRTLIGFADTDGFILVFSLLISFFWIKSLFKESQLLYAALAGFSIFLFEITWTGYWHMLFLVAGASLINVLIHYYTKKKIDLLPAAVILLAFFIPHMGYSGSIVEGLILLGLAAALFFAVHAKKWPQYTAFFTLIVCIYFLYAEGLLATPFSLLARGETTTRADAFYPYIGSYISQRQEVTGSFLFENFTITLFLAPLGIFYLLKKKEESYSVAAFFIMYTIGGILMMVSGVRFLLILSVPLLLLSSVALSFLWAFVKGSPGRKTVAACGILILFVPVYITAEQINEPEIHMTDDWWGALQWINENTPKESVIIADWEYGYWVESIAKRKSIMNGGHYDIGWRLLKFGKMLETSQEDIAVKEVFGFDIHEVKDVRQFPEGETGLELMEKEMTAFAVEQQDAYLVLDSRTAQVFDIISYFGTWDYTTGRGDPVHLYGGAAVGTVLQPYWKQYLYNTLKHQVVVYESQGEYHSFILEKNTLLPTEGTVYTKEDTFFLKREEGNGVVWFYSDSLTIFMPSDALDVMLVRLFFFNGDGLGYFELVADFGTVKVFKIHREFQEDLNEPVIVESDEWSPY